MLFKFGLREQDDCILKGIYGTSKFLRQKCASHLCQVWACSCEVLKIKIRVVNRNNVLSRNGFDDSQPNQLIDWFLLNKKAYVFIITNRLDISLEIASVTRAFNKHWTFQLRAISVYFNHHSAELITPRLRSIRPKQFSLDLPSFSSEF